jgi:hypothetical protein
VVSCWCRDGFVVVVSFWFRVGFVVTPCGNSKQRD